MVVVCVLTIPFLYPFFFLASTALRTRQDYIRDPMGIPTEISFENLQRAWEFARLGPALLTSSIAVGLAIVILVVTSAAAAFWFLRHSGRAAKFALIGMLAFWAVPFIVYALPLYVMLARSGLLNNVLVLSAVYAAINVPFGIYMLYAYFQRGIPPELLEAAAVDGASTWRIFISIVLPLGRPAIATLAALGFVWSWGDLIVAAFLLQDPSQYTMTLAASTLVRRTDANTQAAAAAALISLLPVLTVFIFAQRSISRGFAAGSGK